MVFSPGLLRSVTFILNINNVQLIARCSDFEAHDFFAVSVAFKRALIPTVITGCSCVSELLQLDIFRSFFRCTFLWILMLSYTPPVL